MLEHARAHRPDIRRLLWWVLSYGLRRWQGLAVVTIVMLLKIGLDLLQPWPMKILVDHALGNQPLPDALRFAASILPGSASREGLAAWSIAGTIVVFLLGWIIGLA